MFEWINFTLLISSLVLFSLLYIISLRPAKMSEKMGDKAWKFCRNLRVLASIFETVSTFAIILWIWFPIPVVNWKIFNQWWIGLVISLVIFIPGGILMYIGVKDAGKETLTPSEKTEMYGGIYKHIRHPQTTGEMPMFPAIGLAINSWFIFILLLVFISIYVPITMVFEERDLVRRFGDSYRNYQKSTGALLPKINIKRERKNI